MIYIRLVTWVRVTFSHKNRFGFPVIVQGLNRKVVTLFGPSSLTWSILELILHLYNGFSNDGCDTGPCVPTNKYQYINTIKICFKTITMYHKI